MKCVHMFREREKERETDREGEIQTEKEREIPEQRNSSGYSPYVLKQSGINPAS